MTTTYSIPEEAIDGLAELVLYDYSEGGFAGASEGFGMHPELSSGTFLELTEDFKK